MKIALPILSLIMLPALAIQVRYLIFKRGRTKEQRNLAEGLLEAVPHDLCIMGMTLGMATFVQTFNQRATTNPVILVSAVLPIYVMAFIPILTSRRLKLVLGILAYLIGAGTFFSMLI